MYTLNLCHNRCVDNGKVGPQKKWNSVENKCATEREIIGTRAATIESRELTVTCI